MDLIYNILMIMLAVVGLPFFAFRGLREPRFRERLRHNLGFFLPETLAIKQLPIVHLTMNEAIDIRLGRQLLLTQFEGRIEKLDEDAPKVRYAAFCEKTWIAVVFPDIKEGVDILRIERVIV